MLYPSEWQKLTNSCAKLFARENLAALLSSDFANPKTKRQVGQARRSGDGLAWGSGTDRGIRGCWEVWGRHGTHWHLFSTGGDTNKCPALSALQMFGFYWQAQHSGGWEDDRSVPSFRNSPPSGSMAWTSTRLWLHLRRSGTRVRDWSFASELKVWVWDVWLRLFLSWPILANSVWSISVFTSWQEVKLISILWHCFRERMF